MDTLEKIVSSKARAALFHLLFGIGREELHLREIQRRSGLAIETVRKEANNLEKLELLIMRRDGNRSYYSANRNHPLYKEIHQMVIKTSGLSQFLKDSLKNHKISIAFIFGSIATGDSVPASDIDLFIIGDIGFRSASRVLKAPAERFGREINAHIMTIQEFKKRIEEKEHFASEVFHSPKIMIIGTEDEFAGLVQ